MRVLAIDGGGIRGIIPGLVLADLEQRTGKRIWELFDLIAGTSTGGILACALTRPDALTAREIVDAYVGEGPHIFDRSLIKRVTSAEGLLDERYDDAGLKRVLRRFLDDVTLAQARTEIMVTAYEIERRFAFFFRSARARNNEAYNFRMADVAHATSAAPTYFEPAVVGDVGGHDTYALVDGGVFATNPAMCALADVVPANHAPGVELLLSLGTGEHTRPIAVSDARDWGDLGWAPHIVDVVFDGVAETVDFEASRILGDRYVRLQTALRGASDDFDDATPSNMKALQALGAALVRDRAADLERVAAILRQTPSG